MTRYTVVWHVDAENELAELWLAANDRDAVTLATNTIDSHLAADADRKGIAVEGDLRLLVVPPLRVLFAVSEPDRMVRILDVVPS
jgi:hypothetical protein